MTKCKWCKKKPIQSDQWRTPRRGWVFGLLVMMPTGTSKSHWGVSEFEPQFAPGCSFLEGASREAAGGGSSLWILATQARIQTEFCTPRSSLIQYWLLKTFGEWTGKCQSVFIYLFLMKVDTVFLQGFWFLFNFNHSKLFLR